eukprot:SAG22_NODE_4687_length_1192_cov_1.612992_3_plen_50_part_01
MSRNMTDSISVITTDATTVCAISRPIEQFASQPSGPRPPPGPLLLPPPPP